MPHNLTIFFAPYQKPGCLITCIIWLVSYVGKMKQILLCDWLNPRGQDEAILPALDCPLPVNQYSQ